MAREAPILLRRFRVSDIENALELWNTTPGIGVSHGDEPAELRRFLNRNRKLCLIAESDHAVAGTILCGFDGRRGYVYHLAVRTEFRRRGLAASLVRAALDRLKQAGARRCHAMVFADNQLAHHFWAAIGWRNREDIGLYSCDL